MRERRAEERVGEVRRRVRMLDAISSVEGGVSEYGERDFSAGYREAFSEVRLGLRGVRQGRRVVRRLDMMVV